MEGVSELPVRR